MVRRVHGKIGAVINQTPHFTSIRPERVPKAVHPSRPRSTLLALETPAFSITATRAVRVFDWFVLTLPRASNNQSGELPGFSKSHVISYHNFLVEFRRLRGNLCLQCLPSFSISVRPDQATKITGLNVERP